MIFMKFPRLLIAAFCFCLLVGPFSSAMAFNFSTSVFEFQQKMAKKGDPLAQYKLAYMYENGQGTEKNLDQAVAWYKKSEKKHYAPATMRLIYIETKTQGYKKSKHNAWLTKLKQDAANNDGESLFLLGTMHKDGYIVKKDLNKAARLFKNASKKGMTGAEIEYESVQAILYNQKDRQRQAESQRKARANTEKAKKDAELQSNNKKKTEKQRQQQLATQQAQRERAAAEKKRKQKEKKARLQEKKRKEQQRIAADKKAKAEQEQKAKEAKKSEEAKKAKQEEKPLVDKSMCKGKKARFLTTCR